MARPATPIICTQVEEELQQLRGQLAALQAEMACQQALVRAVAAREDRYRKLIEASNDAILVIDPEHDQILEANPTACRMLGYSQAELLALPVSAIHPHEIAEMTHFVQAVVRQGKGWTNELSCRTKIGALLPAEISASIVEMAEHNCLLALIRDTTERKRAEARIRQEAARADALARVAARLNAQLDLDTVLQAICEETTNALGVPAAVLLFFDEKQGVFYPAATYLMKNRGSFIRLPPMAYRPHLSRSTSRTPARSMISIRNRGRKLWCPICVRYPILSMATSLKNMASTPLPLPASIAQITCWARSVPMRSILITPLGKMTSICCAAWLT